jgi:hypothetical protein
MRYLAWHLGLGDAIAFAGLALKIADGKSLTVPCWQHNYNSVKSFFANHKNITVQVVKNEAGFESADFQLGYFKSVPPNDGESHIEWMYRQANENVANRFEYCPLIQAAKLVKKIKKDGDFIFVHDDESRGYNISLKTIFKKVSPENTGKSILAYSDILYNAKEIHCIDSSFLHLTEAIWTSGSLTYHQYARPYHPLSNYKFRKDWTIIK